VEISLKTIEDYQGTNQRHVLYTGMLEDFLKHKDEFESELSKKLGVE